jgi:RHS repeat-associated protein
MILTLIARAALSSRITRGAHFVFFCPCFLFFCFFLLVLPSPAQVATGTPPFNSFAGGPDTVNLASLNADLNIPIIQKAGRGLPFALSIDFNTYAWYPLHSGTHLEWAPAGSLGLPTMATPWGGTSASETVVNGGCEGRYPVYQYSNWTYIDSGGTPHPFSFTTGYSPLYSACTSSETRASNDGSGWTLSVTGGTANWVSAPNGTVITFGAASTIRDRNGNEISLSNSTGGSTYTDTLGTAVLTTAWVVSSDPTSYTYTAPSGAQPSITPNLGTYTVQTNFGCSGINEFGPTSMDLVSSIPLPDGSQYSFTYETTPGAPGNTTGRVASVTLPTGGRISYSYSGGNNGINCSDGSTATLSRATPDGTWIYAQVKGTGSATTTTVTDPQGNQTIISFLGGYETQREVYQGLTTSGTLLRTLNTCYNGATSPCTGTGFGLPITSITVLDQYGSSGPICEHVYSYNSYGLPTEQDDYDYGSGAPGALLRKSLTTYASLGNGIVSMPATTTICSPGGTASACNGSGTVVAQMSYTYDGTTPLTSSGVAQHVLVTGSRGNLTSINYPVSGLTANFTYWDTGSLNTSQDVNGGTTTYNYSSNAASCQMGFPTGITEAISTLIQSYTWNCTGGVQTQLTDENGNNITTKYNDPYYWRPASVTDQTGAVTNYCYATLSAGACPATPSSTQTETYLNFNSGSSTADWLTTLDGLGRVHVQQRRQSPTSSNFDTVETDYDFLGRPSRTTVPYVGTAGQTCSSCPATSTTYDALSRPLQVKDGGNGTTSYAYNGHDVLVAVGPAPTGENLKQRQLEYNSIEWLTSVCEITTILSGNGACGQSNSETGYWTKYTYDVLGDLLTVTQNAQASSGSQTRTYTYDAIGRLTSQTNPETAQSAITYIYDTLGSGTCAGTSHGDLIKRVDAIGNITCYGYDQLHRILSLSYSTTSPTISTPTKNFVYDSATVDAATMQNAKTRLAEAYTGPSSAKITDEGFSYTARGELTNFYELTPHSNPAYYSIPQTYWPNGATNTLSNNIATLPLFTYGVDGEGRPSSVSVGAGYGQNPVTSTVYNMYTSPNQLTVTFGSGDSDVFTFDSNTMRMNKYQFKIGSQTVTGTLGWNANWSLGTLGINDPFSTANTQACNYTSDDLARISQASCGTIWGQNFTYDPFGNIQKNAISGTGATSFTPTYQSSPSVTNRVSSLGGTSTTYDTNGNSLNDTFRTYSWDAENRPVTIGSVGLTYDALGRMVEQGVTSTYSEVVYTPAGAKLALMNGTTLAKAFVPLTGGDTAVYTSSGLAYYRHTDHLGSSRFASTPTQSLYADMAYSPFGELYAQSGAIDPSFTGQNQDTTSGLYDFLFREYDPNQARWTSPDPAGLTAVDLTNPQSWNRYAYVLNNPLANLDPTGLDCVYFNNDDETDYDIEPGDCRSDNDDGYYVAGSVTGIVTTDDGQVTGVELDDGDVSNPVGTFGQNSPGPGSLGPGSLGPGPFFALANGGPPNFIPKGGPPNGGPYFQPPQTPPRQFPGPSGGPETPWNPTPGPGVTENPWQWFAYWAGELLKELKGGGSLIIILDPHTCINGKEMMGNPCTMI